MRIWILEAIYEPWLVNNWYEHTDKMVVYAATDGEARDLADQATAGEWEGYVPAMQHPFLNDKQTSCEEVHFSRPIVVMKCS